MRRSSRSAARLTFSIIAASLSLAPVRAAAQTAEPVVHDPVIIQAGDAYYLFCTGRGIDVWTSPDRETWTKRPRVFDEAPGWVTEMLPEFRNHIWAPDIYEEDGVYYLYYSVSAFGRNNSAIGVATNTTLDADAEGYEWVDHGPVVRSVPGRDLWNAIDAAVVRDGEGRAWMTFGSHWGGLKLCRLDDSLTSLADPPWWRTVAARHRYWKLDERDAGDSANPELAYDQIYSPKVTELNRASQSGAIEAPFLYRKGDWWCLFVSWDRCCRGVDSTYKVVVGRSKEIEGPYHDRVGERMDHGGGTLVIEGIGQSERWAAAGHNAVYGFDGADYLVCHAYDKKDNGLPKLMIREIAWDASGWPTVEADP